MVGQLRYCVLLLCSLSLNLHALEVVLSDHEKAFIESHPIITLGTNSNWAPYVIQTDDGSLSGFDKELLDLINQKTGANFQLTTGLWKDMVAQASDRTIDGLSTSAYHKERAKLFNFSKPYITVQRLLYVSHTNPKEISSINDLEGAKVGFQKNNLFDTKVLQQYESAIPVPLSSLEEMLNSLVIGQIDAALGSHALAYTAQRSGLHYLQVADQVPNTQLDMVFSIRKDYPEALSILNKGIDALQSEIKVLARKWFLQEIKKDINALNDAERNFLKTNPDIRFRVRSNRPPFEFYSNGEASGIAVDYIKAIGKQIGFKPIFVRNDESQAKAIEHIHNKQTDFDTLLYASNTEELKDRLWFGDNYLSFQLMIIARKDQNYFGDISLLANKKVVIEEGTVATDWISRDHPSIQLLEANSARQALELLNNKQADAFLGNLTELYYSIDREAMDDVQVMAPSGYEDVELSFVAPHQWPELANILSKGFRKLSPTEHQSIRHKWFSSQVLEKTNYLLLVQILFAGAVIILWISGWNRKLAHAKDQREKALLQLSEVNQQLSIANKKLEMLSVTDKLTGLWNRLKMDDVFSYELDRAERYGDSFSIAIVDIDEFKQVNDTHGHQIGDKVLNLMAAVLKRNIRKIDSVGRWGGEEFLIICPNTNKHNIIQVAENLRSELQKHEYDIAGRRTASFGLTSFIEGDTKESMLARADKALYDAKNNGRNKVYHQAA